MSEKREKYHPMSKPFPWAVSLAVTVGLALMLGSGCGLLGGGEAKPKASNEVSKPVTGQNQPSGAGAKTDEKSKEDMLAALREAQKKKQNEFVFSRYFETGALKGQPKPDPFRPNERVMAPEPKDDEEDEGKGFLETRTLSQLKLVAVVVTKGSEQGWAMVEDSTGIGYIIREGTKIGKRGGVVTGIMPGVVKIHLDYTNRFNERVQEEVELTISNREGEKK